MTNSLPSCECGRDDLARRETMGLTPLEDLILDVSRLIFDIHGNGNGAAWLTAIDLTEQAAGPGTGPLLLARATAFVRAMLAERQGCFQFLTAGCRHMTQHEVAMLEVLKSARGKDWHALNYMAQSLAGAESVQRIVSSALTLAGPISGGTPVNPGSGETAVEPLANGVVWH